MSSDFSASYYSNVLGISAGYCVSILLLLSIFWRVIVLNPAGYMRVQLIRLDWLGLYYCYTHTLLNHTITQLHTIPKSLPPKSSLMAAAHNSLAFFYTRNGTATLTANNFTVPTGSLNTSACWLLVSFVLLPGAKLTQLTCPRTAHSRPLA